MSDQDSKIRKLPADLPDVTALRNEAHALLDTMSPEQIIRIIPYLKSLV